MKSDNCDSGSSSEEEAVTNALREATDHDFYKESLFNAKETKVPENAEKQKNVINLKSLRTNLEQEDVFGAFRVAPGLKKFVAKKLDEILEKSIKLDKKGHANTANEKKRKIVQDEAGIKLLRTSTNYLTIIDELDSSTIKRRKHSSVEIKESGDDIKRFQEAAVDPEWVLSKTDTKAWTSKRKEPEFKYKKKNGIFVAEEQTFSSISAMKTVI